MNRIEVRVNPPETPKAAGGSQSGDVDGDSNGESESESGADGGMLRFCIGPDERFAVHFTHSVELTWVVEEYQVREGTLVMVATEYSSYGAGLPFSAEGGRFVMGEGSYRLEGLEREVGRRLSFLTYPVNDWYISYPKRSEENGSYSFTDSKLGTKVSIEVVTGKGEA